jgi:hypothetical protein
MAYYRLYFFDPDDRIAQVVELHCDEDGQAVEEARSRADGRTMELWNEGRFVAILDGQAPAQAEAEAEARKLAS